MLRYNVPVADSQTRGITAGPDGAMWFADGAGKIGRITPAGTITEFPVPFSNSSPLGIATGSDGALWFTDSGTNSIGRITTTGTVTEYPLPTPLSGVGAITAAPPGATSLWFLESTANQIGSITTSGVITEYPVPTPASGLTAITRGPQNALWFTELDGHNVGRVTLTGQITEYYLGTVQGTQWPATPYGITEGSDGAIWVGETYGYDGADWIGRMADGAITWHDVGYNLIAVQLTRGPDGAVWFTNEDGGAVLGRMSTAGVYTGYPGGTNGWIASGSNSTLWMTQSSSNGQIVEAIFVTANLTVTPDSGVWGTALTFTGSGFAANETVRIFREGVGSATLAVATADSSGSFTASGLAPQSTNGSRVFLGVGETSGSVGAAPFSITAGLVMSPNEGAAGSTTKVQGYGFDPGESVSIYWQSSKLQIGTATANANGSFIGSAAPVVTIPAGVTPGVYVINAINSIKEAPQGEGTFTVQ